MKVIEDILKLEIKLLIRFLKENHIFQQFFIKMLNENNYNAPKTLTSYIEYIKNERFRYTGFFPIYKILEDEYHTVKFVVSNESLFSDLILFCNWTDYPLVLSKRSCLEEGFEWCNYTQKFIEFKKFLKRINGYEKYFK